MTATTLVTDRAPVERRLRAVDPPRFAARRTGTESRSEARARRKRTMADAHAATLAARADLDAAIARGEREYRRLAARLSAFDRELSAVRWRLVTRR